MSEVVVERENMGLSVARIFLVLESLAANKRPMTLTEIALELDLPKSSMLKLLKGLAQLGYLTEEPRTKTYFPSMKICELADDIERMWLGHNEHLAMLEEIRDATEESVGLAIQHDIYVRYHNSLAGRHQVLVNLNDGIQYPLYYAAAGRMILSTLSDSELQKTLQRIKKKMGEQAADLDPDRLRENLVNIRKNGYATTDRQMMTDVLGISMLLPSKTAIRPIAVSIVGLKERMLQNEKDIVARAKEIIERYSP